MRSTILRGSVVALVLAASRLALGGSPILNPPPTKSDDLLAMFKDPPTSYRILFLLRTNDEVTKEEIAWQVRSIKEQGGGGVFSYCEHLEGGSPEKFLTDWWWKVVDYTAEACAKEGVEFWAYDEEDWPSGTAGGLLLRHHPDLTWKYIRLAEHRIKGPTSVELALIKEPLVAALAFQLEGKTLKADSIVDLTGRVKDLRLNWDVPAGEWTVAVYTAATARLWNNAEYPDLMSKRAGAAFVDLVYRAHDERVRQIPGAGIVGFFTDEPSCNVANYPAGALFPWVPAMPYSFDLPEEFKKQHGYDWRTSLPLLYHEAGPKSLQFRCHHWQTCNRLYCDNYFGQIFRFCEQHNQIASGHIHVEESLMAHLTLQGGNVLAIYRNMHVPGIDWIYPFTNALPAHVPKFASSMAHLTGRPRTWCESFAASGYGLTFQQMRRIVDWEHVNGINMQIPICYKYSLRGPKRAQFYTPGISYQQPYWDHFRAFADYEARLCLLTAGLGHIAQVALVYPNADLWAHCWDHDLLNARSVEYFKLGDALREAGYDYDVLDDEAIQKDARVDNGALATATERFAALILPQVDTVSRATLQQAIDLAKAHGIVLMVGGLPRHSIEAGSDDPEVIRMVRELLGPTCYEQVKDGKEFWRQGAKVRVGFAPGVENVASMLRTVAVPDLMTASGSEGLCSLHRRLADGELYLVLNRKSQPRTATFTLSGQGRPEKWNPITGLAEDVGDYEITPQGTRITLEFAADEFVPLILRPAGAGETKGTPKAREIVRETPIPGPFKFRPEHTLDRPHLAWNFKDTEKAWTATQPAFLAGELPAAIPSELPAGDWSTHGLAYFSGLGHYEIDVQVDALPPKTKAILDLGKVGVSAQVLVNGQPAGIVFVDPYRLDVTRYLKTGPNHLEIVVANTLANYYGQFKELAKADLWNGGSKPEHRVSGLIGPVTLRVTK